MQSPFDYNRPEHHVEQRAALSPAIRSAMLAVPRERWAEDPKFQGEPAFWLDIHRGLLRGSATLVGWTGELLESSDAAGANGKARRIANLGTQLIHHAHGHHHIEDHYFFPVFLRLYPKLQNAIELLDGDHRVLSEVLEDLEKAVANFAKVQPGDGGKPSDALMGATEALHKAAHRLDALFIRHIGDEEEICVPAMLNASFD